MFMMMMMMMILMMMILMMIVKTTTMMMMMTTIVTCCDDDDVVTGDIDEHLSDVLPDKIHCPTLNSNKQMNCSIEQQLLNLL